MIKEIKNLEELNLIDNYLFETMMSDETIKRYIGRIILRAVLGVDYRELNVYTENYFWPNSLDMFGVHFYGYIKDDDSKIYFGDGKAYDISNGDWTNARKRIYRNTRLYHPRIRARMSETDEKFVQLKYIWEIFVLPYDPFGADRMVYTVRGKCLEVPELDCDDGITSLYLYTRGTKGDLSPELKNLMKFFENTIQENAVTDDLRYLYKLVDSMKNDRRVIYAYASFCDFLRYIRSEAIRRAKKKYNLNNDIDEEDDDEE